MSLLPLPSEASLPIPDAGDVAGFVELYRETYQIELDEVRAAEILGGLMRWVWLTRERPGEAGAEMS